MGLFRRERTQHEILAEEAELARKEPEVVYELEDPDYYIQEALASEADEEADWEEGIFYSNMAIVALLSEARDRPESQPA